MAQFRITYVVETDSISAALGELIYPDGAPNQQTITQIGAEEI